MDDDLTLAVTLLYFAIPMVVVALVLNLGVERIWFPRPRRAVAGSQPVPPLVGSTRRGHIIMGSVEAVLFIAGWILIVMACAVMGTRGYGSF